jgi:hypothetical protein
MTWTVLSIGVPRTPLVSIGVNEKEYVPTTSVFTIQLILTIPAPPERLYPPSI